jgi:hypothetical protein
MATVIVETMTTTDTQAMQRQLHQNEQQCIRSNIIVHVDSIAMDGSVAMCSVEQCLFGLLRHEVSNEELVWRAERALAPLRASGQTALITARRRRHHIPRAHGWLAALWQWSGYPMARRGYMHRQLVNDPFGWQRAMAGR